MSLCSEADLGGGVVGSAITRISSCEKRVSKGKPKTRLKSDDFRFSHLIYRAASDAPAARLDMQCRQASLRSICPSARSGQTASRTRRFSSVISGKPPSFFLSQIGCPLASIQNTPPVPGCRATSSSSSLKVASSSCAYQPLRSSQLHGDPLHNSLHAQRDLKCVAVVLCRAGKGGFLFKRQRAADARFRSRPAGLSGWPALVVAISRWVDTHLHNCA